MPFACLIIFRKFAFRQAIPPPHTKKIACPLSSRAALLHTLHRFSLLHIKNNFTAILPRNSYPQTARSVPHAFFLPCAHKKLLFPLSPPREIFRRLFLFLNKAQKNRICRPPRRAAVFHSPPALFPAHSTPHPKANCPPTPPRRSLSLITRAVSRTFSLLPTKPTFHKRPHATLSLTAHAVSRAFPLQKQNRICRTSTAAPAHIHKPTAPQKYDKSDC